MPKCASCDADVTFVRSGVSQHSLILDAKPRKDVVILPRRVAKLLNEQVARTSGDPDQQVALVTDVWTDHHVTCPYAALHRKDGPLAGDAGKARRVAANIRELLVLVAELARYPLDDESDARLHALVAEAKVLKESIEP